MTTPSRRSILAAYDVQLRRAPLSDGVGAHVEIFPDLVRHVPGEADGWSAVLWTDLDETTADAVIADQVRFFGSLGHAFQWRRHDYDHPADLSERLLAAGFTLDDEDAVMIADVATVDHTAAPPPGVRLVPVVDDRTVSLFVQIHEEVFGTDHAWLGRALLDQLARTPDEVIAILAMAGDLAVCSARMKMGPHQGFASLYGGSTLPEWRGRGIYRALVAYRARMAAARGYRYLHVDASAESRPILERLGFIRIATMTVYVRRP